MPVCSVYCNGIELTGVTHPPTPAVLLTCVVAPPVERLALNDSSDVIVVDDTIEEVEDEELVEALATELYIDDWETDEWLLVLAALSLEYLPLHVNWKVFE